jgi:phosphoglycerate dehydrogenase-like enzyme
VKRRAACAVLPAGLEDDFDVARDTQGVLSRLDLRVVERPETALRDAEILVTGLSGQRAAGREFVRSMPGLRWVHSMTAGVEDLVCEELVERDVLVTNGAGAYATAIAEYAFAAMVLLARRLPELMLAGARRRWTEPHPLGSELAGKVVGIVGYGGIGRTLGRLCSGAGMTVRGLRRRPGEGELGPEQLPELLAESDFVVLAASLNPSSRGLIGRAELGLMREGGYLVNVSRGALLDERALADALRSGHLAGAMLDVVAAEPLADTSELWDVPNLWITPHMSGGSRESRDRAFDVLVANVVHYLAGRLEEMTNVVDVRRELG